MSAEKYKKLRALNVSGTVMLAENTEDGGKCVLKVLPEECVPIYRRFSELPAQENLMPVYEIIREDDRTAAVCGFAEGATLEELLDGGRVFPAAELCRIMTQLCRAAEHLHRNGIIHRDITPKNIILDDKLHLTLIDYGISRLFAGNREQDTTLYGTEGFAPPEQYGFRETSYTADIYAVGTVLKLLLNGCPDCSPAREVLLRKIAAKCTQFVPEKRFKSAAAVRRAVSRSGNIVPVGITAASAVLLTGIISAAVVVHNVGREAPPVSEVRLHPEYSAQTTAATVATTPKTTTATTAQTTATTPKTTAQTTSTTPETTTATTAQTTPVVVVQPQEFHTSDMDNPDMITITTLKNERGLYEDVFGYQFYDDPKVHGKWRLLNTIPEYSFNTLLTARKLRDIRYDGVNLISALYIGDNGEAAAYSTEGEECNFNARWTNGYLIFAFADSTVAQSFFEVTIGGEEFLFVGVKTGDYLHYKEVYFYDIYIREG